MLVAPDGAAYLMGWTLMTQTHSHTHVYISTTSKRTGHVDSGVSSVSWAHNQLFGKMACMIRHTSKARCIRDDRSNHSRLTYRRTWKRSRRLGKPKPKLPVFVRQLKWVKMSELVWVSINPSSGTRLGLSICFFVYHPPPLRPAIWAMRSVSVKSFLPALLFLPTSLSTRR